METVAEDTPAAEKPLETLSIAADDAVKYPETGVFVATPAPSFSMEKILQAFTSLPDVRLLAAESRDSEGDTSAVRQRLQSKITADLIGRLESFKVPDGEGDGAPSSRCGVCGELVAGWAYELFSHGVKLPARLPALALHQAAEHGDIGGG